MGIQKNIGYDRFPKQTDFSGKQVEVCFNYDPSKSIKGFIVRSDEEEPFICLIQLVDGRILLDTECQYSFS